MSLGLQDFNVFKVKAPAQFQWFWKSSFPKKNKVYFGPDQHGRLNMPYELW